MWSDWFLRLRSLFGSRAIDGEVDEELRFHLDHLIERHLAAGLSRDEACRRARLDLGGLAQIKEEHRDARGTAAFFDLARDVRYALRTLARLPGFATAAVGMLALAIGAGTVVFTVIHSVLLRPLPYPEADRLLTLRATSGALGEVWGFSYPDFLDLSRDSRAFEAAAWTFGSGTVSAPGDPVYIDGRQVSASLFPVLGTSFALGRGFLPEEDRPGGMPVVVISEQLWQRRYQGNAAVIGQVLVFAGKPRTVVGVARDGLDLNGRADVFTPLGQNTELRMQNRDARFLHVLARLGSAVTLAQGRTELAGIGLTLAARFPASNSGRGFIAYPLLTEVVGDVGTTLWLLLGAVGVLLAIAGANVASLLLARVVAREGEMATRAALGASRGRLIRQCVTESAVLGLLGGLAGVLLASAGIEPFLAIWPGDLPRLGEIRLNGPVLAAALAVSLVSGLVFGILPALRAPISDADRALRATARTLVTRSRRAHGTLVVIELALAVVLLVSAGSLVRTLITFASREPGFDAQDIVVARVALEPGVLNDPIAIDRAWTDILDRTRRLPDVDAAALTDIVPMRPGENTLPYSTTPAQRPSNESPVALASSVTPDYLTVMGIPLLAGRFLDERDRGRSEPVVVIDDSLALHAFGRTDVVDRALWVPAISPSPIRIVGVVGHVRHWGLANDDRSPVRDQMYYAFAQVPPRLLRLFSTFMSVAIRTPRPEAVANRLQANIDRAFGQHALHEVRTMEQLVNRSLARQRFLVRLFTILGGIALLLACVGVYGVLAYLTSQRAAEFGVRLALGATSRDLVRLVLSESAGLILTGLTIGSIAAWGCGLAIQHFVAGAQSAGPATIASMTALLAVAALFASFLPARRASRLNPVQVLRKA